MAHYESEELGISFDLPDNPSVIDIITYDSTRMERHGEPALVILWECVKPLITNWACEHMPDKDTPLAKAEGQQAALCVEWAAFRGSEWRNGLQQVPKNS